MKWKQVAALLLLGMIFPFAGAFSQDSDKDRIQPYAKNRYYWQYKGKPVMLLGGTMTDKLFQVPTLISQLDLLQSVGGNYVRNTMSSYAADDPAPFARVGEKFNLDRWDQEYWRRFRLLLAESAKRDIIVQIEVWATFNYYRVGWERNAFNPKNNVNYTVAESGLPTEVTTHPTSTENDFFRSVPKGKNLKVVLSYQERFVEKMLSYSLPYGNVLYCMDNETSVTPNWGAYWAKFIRRKAAEAGKQVETTEMWDAWNLSDESHDAIFLHPETYTFLDISQNNHQKGQTHYDNALKRRHSIKAQPRPLTNTKIYGGLAGTFGAGVDGTERFWRNIFGGHAGARFHRPWNGHGLTEWGQMMIRSARDVTDAFDLFSAEPRNDLLGEREENEAYCLATPGKQYAVYFPRPGEVTLDLSDARGTLLIRWYDIHRKIWYPAEEIQGGGVVTLRVPGRSQFAVVIK